MEKENLTFPEALRSLAERYHIPIPDQRRISPQVLKLEEQILKVNESALTLFRKNLTGTPEGGKAQDYLHEARLDRRHHPDWKIGYALNSWDALSGYFRGKGMSPSLLEKAGLVGSGQKARRGTTTGSAAGSSSPSSA